MSSVLYTEIFEQPDAMARALRESHSAVAALIAEVRRRDIRFVVFVARGTSDNAATYAKYLFQILCGVPVALAAPSVHTLYASSVDYGRQSLVIGISQSGAGEDVCEVIAQARASGALTVALTNTDPSLLAQTAEFTIPCHAGVERAVAATKTYTTTITLLALLAALWSDNRAFQKQLFAVPVAAQKILVTASSPLISLASSLFHAEKMITAARGPHIATAMEAALKIAETTGTTTQAFSAADLLHGPVASVAARTPCLLFAPTGNTAAGMAALAKTLEARGARVLRFSAEPDAEVTLGDPGDELLAPLVDILPAQLLAYHLTVLRGLDPDNPRGLKKVTITR